MTSRLKPLPARTVETLTETAFVGGAPGLQLMVREGVRTWRLFYRLPGSTKRLAMKLGRFPDLSLKDARLLALEKLALASDGRDPREERRERAAAIALTISDNLDAYLAACATQNDPKTVADKRSALGNALRPHGDDPVGSFDRRKAVAVLDGLADRPALRRVTFAYLRHFLGWCAEREIIPLNPMLGLRPPRMTAARDRILSNEEIRALWTATGVFAEIARLSLLTAQRRGAIERLRWRDIDVARAVWTVPAEAMKSARIHEVPLSVLALDIIKRQARLGAFVFGVGSGGEKPFAGGSNGMDGLRTQLLGRDWRATTPEAWRLHDIRRTAVTLAQRGGASVEEIRALTQHKTPGVIGVYARHSYSEEKRRVVEIIAEQVAAILRARPETKSFPP